MKATTLYKVGQTCRVINNNSGGWSKGTKVKIIGIDPNDHHYLPYRAINIDNPNIKYSKTWFWHGNKDLRPIVFVDINANMPSEDDEGYYIL